MKKLAIFFAVLSLAACQKTKNKGTDCEIGTPVPTNSNKGAVAAKINNRQWTSAARTTADSSTYLAARNDGGLQIKTFGRFTDSMGVTNDDQLGIYISRVTDTGIYTLSMTNYITYSALSAEPQYYSTQAANIGFVHITRLTDSTVSGTFECQVDNTGGTGGVSVKEGAFTDVVFQ